MRATAMSSLSTRTLVVLLCAWLSQVSAMTYLESLAAKRRPTGAGSLHNSTLPSRTSAGAISSHDIEMQFPHLFGRQAAGNGDLASLNTCQTIAVTVPLLENKCTSEDKQVTETTLIGGLLKTVVKTVTVVTCIPITVNITIIDQICICAAAGALTPQSALDLRTFFIDVNNNKTGSPLATLTTYRNGTVGYTVDSLIQYLGGPTGLPTVLRDGRANDPCGYPVGSIPKCSANCGFDCPDGQRVCNDRCTAAAQCPSGVTGRKRAIEIKQVELDLRCPRGRSACFPPSFGKGRASHLEDRMECIDTMRDIESCGGCAFPLPGRQKGIDCTDIPNAGDVACVSGVCRVMTCRPGYIAVGGSKCQPIDGMAGGDHPLLEINGTDTVLASATHVEVDFSERSLTAEAQTLDAPPEERKSALKKLLANRQVSAKQIRDREAAKAKKAVQAQIRRKTGGQNAFRGR